MRGDVIGQAESLAGVQGLVVENTDLMGVTEVNQDVLMKPTCVKLSSSAEFQRATSPDTLELGSGEEKTDEKQIGKAAERRSRLSGFLPKLKLCLCELFFLLHVWQRVDLCSCHFLSTPGPENELGK